MSEAEDVCVTFVRAWSESVLRQVARVKDVSREAAKLNRQLDHEWDPSTDEALSAIWRQNWTEAHALVWSIHQLDRWGRRLAEERGEEPPREHLVLRDVRNTLEHLDEARLDKGHVAEPGEDQSRNRSMRRLPGGRLYIATGGKLFGSLELAELETIAREQLERMKQESMEREEAMIEAAVDSYIDSVIDARRETR